MANITTFATLKSQILAIIGRAPADHVYQVVTQEINRDLRLHEMEATTTATEAATVDLSGEDPAVLSIVDIYRDDTPRRALRPVTADFIQKAYRTAGDPLRYAFVNETLLLDAPGDGTTLNIRYNGALSLLSADDDTNAILTTYPNIYLYGSLYHHGMPIGDPRAAGWGKMYESAMGRAVARDQADRLSGGSVEVRAPGSTP